jgi:serine/threonine protein kinase
MISGKPPYWDLNPFTAMTKIVKEAMPPFPNMIMSDELKDFLFQCLAKDPYKRMDAKGLLNHKWVNRTDKS